MSAPDTNLEKQKRRHRGPLLGIIASILLVGALFLGYLGILADRAPTPDAQDAQVPATVEN